MVSQLIKENGKNPFVGVHKNKRGADFNMGA